MVERLEKHVQNPAVAGEDIPEQDEDAGRKAVEEFLTLLSQPTEEESSPFKVKDPKRGDRVDPVTEAEVCAVILRRQEERLGKGRRTSLRRMVFNQRIRDRVTRSNGRCKAE